ncbi:MAG: hypothetical protein ACREQB_01410 [Candidatus Binataceae bacterium]
MGETVHAVGLDFGSTNSAIAVIGAEGEPRLARFHGASGGGVRIFRR